MDNDDVQKYKIAILDDEAMWRNAIIDLLDREPSLIVVGAVATQAKAVDLASNFTPDIFLVDMMLKHSWQTGVSATIAILDASPTTKVIILTSCENEEDVVKATSVGAVDYLSKSDCEELLPVILLHLRGGFSPRAILAKMVANLRQEQLTRSLTEQEKEVLKHLLLNVPRSQLANVMCKSESTIKSQVGSILKKLMVSNISDAIDKVNHGGVLFPQQKINSKTLPHNKNK